MSNLDRQLEKKKAELSRMKNKMEAQREILRKRQELADIELELRRAKYPRLAKSADVIYSTGRKVGSKAAEFVRKKLSDPKLQKKARGFFKDFSDYSDAPQVSQRLLSVGGSNYGPRRSRKTKRRSARQSDPYGIGKAMGDIRSGMDFNF